MNIQYFWYLKVIWQHIYIVSYNLKRLFKWISYTANRKWRDRRNGKNAGKIKLWILCMDVIYGGGGGSRFPSLISNFESPLSDITCLNQHRSHGLYSILNYYIDTSYTHLALSDQGTSRKSEAKLVK